MTPINARTKTSLSGKPREQGKRAGKSGDEPTHLSRS